LTSVAAWSLPPPPFFLSSFFSASMKPPALLSSRNAFTFVVPESAAALLCVLTWNSTIAPALRRLAMPVIVMSVFVHADAPFAPQMFKPEATDDLKVSCIATSALKSAALTPPSVIVVWTKNTFFAAAAGVGEAADADAFAEPDVGVDAAE